MKLAREEQERYIQAHQQQHPQYRIDQYMRANPAEYGYTNQSIAEAYAHQRNPLNHFNDQYWFLTHGANMNNIQPDFQFDPLAYEQQQWVGISN